MKLSWRDLLTTLFVAAGGVVVFAKIQEYAWWFVGDSWQTATATLAGLGLAAVVSATYGVRKEGMERNLFDDVDIGVAVIAAGVAVAGVIVDSEVLFYTLASIMGALWLTSLARHLTHSLNEPDTYHHAPV